MSMILLENIKKTYNKGSVVAASNINISVQKGEIFGLIGPDGAGKSTLFRILTTLLIPDEGRATVNGFDTVKEYAAIRNCVGYMPGRFSLYTDLTVEENLEFFASLFNTSIKENYELIKDIYVQIEPFKNRRAGKLSGGMKQKLALCCALIHKPVVLFLDEPTTGVDVVSRKEFWDMLKKLKSQGITILVSTPYMDETALCDRIAFLQNGEVLSIDTPQNIVKSYPDTLYALKAKNIYHLLKDLKADPRVESVFAFGEFLHTTFTNKPGEAELETYKKELKDRHEELYFEVTAPGIEDCFIKLLKS